MYIYIYTTEKSVYYISPETAIQYNLPTAARGLGQLGKYLYIYINIIC